MVGSLQSTQWKVVGHSTILLVISSNAVLSVYRIRVIHKVVNMMTLLYNPGIKKTRNSQMSIKSIQQAF